MSKLANPVIIFLLVWLTPLIFVINIPVQGYGLSLSDPIVMFLAVNIFLLIICFLLSKLMLSGYKDRPLVFFKDESQLQFSIRSLDKLFLIWLSSYIFVIVLNGGFPLIWLLIGDPRTYVDFGIASVSGFQNMIRAFLASTYFLIFLKTTGNKKALRYKLIFLLFSCFFMEMSRGNGTFLLFHLVGVYFICNALNPRKIITLVIALYALVIFGAVVQVLRNSHDMIYVLSLAENYGLEFLGGSIFLIAFIPVVAYMTLPLVNLNLKLENLPSISFDIFHSISGIFPSFMRKFIFSTRVEEYGLIIDEAHNVSTFFDPLIRDFGTIFVFVFLFIIYFTISFTFVAMKKGFVFFALIYPPLFASLILSFFSMYFLLLVVIMYPLLVIWFVNVLKRYIRVMAEHNM